MKIVGFGGPIPMDKREEMERFTLDMTGSENPDVLYIATPKAKPETFELALARAKQLYTGLGVSFESLYDHFDTPPTATEIEHKIGQAAVINVSGGDTLRAMERFQEWGVTEPLKQAAHAETVLSGISAGAIIWFVQGHSDSLSYRVDEGEPWDYIWVDGLNLQPGTICPHYNTATEGGEERATNLARMIKESPTPITGPISFSTKRIPNKTSKTLAMYQTIFVPVWAFSALLAVLTRSLTTCLSPTSLTTFSSVRSSTSAILAPLLFNQPAVYS